jgi:hypothetical protein
MAEDRITLIDFKGIKLECNNPGEFDTNFRNPRNPLRVGNVDDRANFLSVCIEQDGWGADTSIRFENGGGGEEAFWEEQRALISGINTYFESKGLRYSHKNAEPRENLREYHERESTLFYAPRA